MRLDDGAAARMGAAAPSFSWGVPFWFEGMSALRADMPPDRRRCLPNVRHCDRSSARYDTNVEPNFELFDHTADLGIRIRASSVAGLLKPASEGLYAAIGELVPGVDPDSCEVHLTGGTEAQLLRDFLNELLLRFEQRKQIAVRIDDPRLDDQELGATIDFRCVDEERSAYHREVKAITYHELAIRSIVGGCEATVIVDI